MFLKRFSWAPAASGPNRQPPSYELSRLDASNIWPQSKTPQCPEPIDTNIVHLQSCRSQRRSPVRPGFKGWMHGVTTTQSPEIANDKAFELETLPVAASAGPNTHMADRVSKLIKVIKRSASPLSKSRRASCDSAVALSPALSLPPLETDFLWLSLAFVEKPLVRTACRVCDVSFHKIWPATACAAWRLHNCRHYVHVMCLADRWSDAGCAAIKDECPSCERFKMRLGRLEDGDREARIRRLEDTLLPWKVDFDRPSQ